ncbi:MAG: response regulator [Thermoanaerobaculales bacterium]|jgi:Fe-S oxidoreductase/CheY-like chemotaxis protein|nr:response regulator [Thermoanaerobaculales bacterium]
MSRPAKTHKVKMMEQQLAKKLTRQVVGSLVGCVHCGMCNDACHYVLAFPDDPKMTPSYKADQLRKLFKANFDWTGKAIPWWVGADKAPLTDDDLEVIKDISFGTCTNCRRCTLSCPMGVDTATLNRIMRGLLSHVGVMPEGVRVVSKDQWELGNQMGVLKEDYVDTLEWMSEELEEDLGHGEAAIPVDKAGAKIMYCINPREVKYDPRTIKEAALIFWAAGESWTMPSEGWDNTNFGLFSGDDGLGGVSARREYDKARQLGVEKIVISECGHGFRSTRCEGVNWAGEQQPVPMESAVMTMLRFIKEGRIKVDPTRNPERVTFHDSCNNARSCGFYEEPRELLKLVTMDFQEMYPNRAENYCCTGGGGAMSMSEYTPRRLESAKVKADQIRATGAKVVVTSCHNCVDGLSDLIKHYGLGCEVKQLVNLVANALVLDEVKEPEAVPAPAEIEVAPVAVASPLAGRKILVVDDEDDVRLFLTTVFEDAGAQVLTASDGDTAVAVAREHQPDLISLDLSMPGKDGVETFVELRRTPETEEIPVCVVTGHPEFRQVIYDRPVAPPEGYLGKPVDEDKLVAYAHHIIEHREAKVH